MFQTVRSECGVKIETQDIKINPILVPVEIHIGTLLVMDSHSYTTCMNKHSFIELILEGVIFNVVPFEKSIGILTNLPIIIAVYTYDKPNTCCTILLQINHDIYTKDMKHSLFCPNQARKYGNIIDEILPHLDHT